jgi:hypothetical protein
MGVMKDSGLSVEQLIKQYPEQAGLTRYLDTVEDVRGSWQDLHPLDRGDVIALIEYWDSIEPALERAKLKGQALTQWCETAGHYIKLYEYYVARASEGPLVRTRICVGDGAIEVLIHSNPEIQREIGSTFACWVSFYVTLRLINGDDWDCLAVSDFI